MSSKSIHPTANSSPSGSIRRCCICLLAVCALATLPAAESWDARVIETDIREGRLEAAQQALAAGYAELAAGKCSNSAVQQAVQALKLRALALLFANPPYNTTEGPGSALRQRVLQRDALIEELAVTLTDNDRPAAAMALIDRLMAKAGTSALNQASLLTAFALVWDNPPQQTWYRARPDDELLAATFKRAVEKMSSGERNRPARMLTFLTYAALTPADWDYVDTNYASVRDNPRRCYTDIRYDLMFFMKGTPKKIDSLPYTLADIKEVGGVCIEQAYHTRGVCHALGVPAVIMAGSGSSGIGHAWVGYLKPGALLEWDYSIGTSPAGNFSVGEFVDPQRGQIMTNLDLDAELPELNGSLQDRLRAAAAARVIETRARLDTSFSAETLVWARVAWDLFPTHRATWDSLLYYVEKVPGAGDGHLTEILQVLAKLGKQHPEIMLARFDRLQAAVEKNGQVFNLRHFDRMKQAVSGNESGEVALEVRLARQEEKAGQRSSASGRLFKIVQQHPKAGNPVLEAADALARLWRMDQKDSQVLPMYLDLLAANKLTHPVAPEVMSMTMYFRLAQRLIVEYKRVGREDDAQALDTEVKKFIGQ